MNNANETLVTGGCGFIGVNLVRLLSETRTVSVFDNLSRPSPTGEPQDNVDVHRGDVLNPDEVAAAIGNAGEVVHLAAYGSVVESIAAPAENFAVNAQGTLHVLQAAADAGVQRLVFASTGGALIGDAPPPVHERSLPRPISPYGASKLCGEAYCHAFARSYGLGTVCLRFGNVYGPHSAHKKGAVTTFIKALMKDEPIVIYGDGSASRDYVHVEDLCRGIQAALAARVPGGEVFHLAGGRETTVLELAHMLRDISGRPHHPIEFRPARRGEVARNFATCDKARDAFGFEPRWRIEDGLAATWAWFESQGESALSAETTDS